MKEEGAGGGFERATIALGVLFGSIGLAGAQWDLSGDSSIRETWAENTTFTSNPGNGDAISSIRLAGRAVRTGRRFHLDATYSPDAQFYRDRPAFNRVSQMGRLMASWDVSERTVLSFSGETLYTPNQGVSPESVQSSLVFTKFTDRRHESTLLALRHSLSARSDLVFDLGHHFQTYSDPLLVDSVGISAAVHLNRKIGTRTSFDAGVANSWNRFVHSTDINPDPIIATLEVVRNESQVATVFASVNRKVGDRMTASGRLGESLVTPGDPSLPRRRGLQAQASLTWSGPRLTTGSGFTRDISTGSGVLSVSETQTFFASIGYKFTQGVSGNLLMNRSISSRSISERTRSGGEPSARAFNGTAQIRCKIARRLDGYAGFTRFIQNVQNLDAPDLAHNSYTIGLSASFD